MQGYFPPKGLIVELITPLNSNLSLSNKDIHKLLTNIKPFADAVMILSPEGGEGLDISIENKKEFLGACAEFIKGKIPIFIFVTSNTEEETIENILLFDNLLKNLSYKGDIFWVDAPLYYHSNRGLVALYEKLTKISNHSFILYNNPKIVEKVKGPFNRKNIRSSILKELSLIEEIKGLVYIGELKRVLNYQKAVRERSFFRIYDGDERLFINFPNKNGLLSISANLIPYIWRNLLDTNFQKKSEYIWYMLKEFLSIIKEGKVALVKKLLNKEEVLSSHHCISDSAISDILLKKGEELLSILKDYV